MITPHFDPKTFNLMDNPLQKLMVLNVKTLQSFSYIKPEQLTKFKKPEEILEKNLDVFITNSHIALDYLQDSFNIFEKILLNVSENTQDQTKQAINLMQSAERNIRKEATASTAKVVKKAKAAVRKGIKNATSIKKQSAIKAKSGLKVQVKKA